MGFCSFGFVEVLVDSSSLRLSETDKVDDVGKDFDQAVVCRFKEIIE